MELQWELQWDFNGAPMVLPGDFDGTRVSPWDSHAQSIVRPWNYSIPMEILPSIVGLPWGFHGIHCKVSQLNFHETSMRLPWDIHETYVFSWGSYGTFVGLPCDFHGTSIGIAWDFHGNSMGLPWGFHWTPIRLQWASMGVIPWDFHGTSVEPPWDFIEV